MIKERESQRKIKLKKEKKTYGLFHIAEKPAFLPLFRRFNNKNHYAQCANYTKIIINNGEFAMLKRRNIDT
jgi:hypothetical protein